MSTSASSGPRRVTIVLWLFVALALLSMFPPRGTAADSSSTDLCVGLECNVPASGSYVPEAHGDVPKVAGLDELLRRENSGFYEMPALVYRGAVQPRAVVYLSKHGEFGTMPSTVRNLPAVQDFMRAQGSNTDTMTLVVVDYGIRVEVPAEARAARSPSQRRRRARIASPSFCYVRTFCLFSGEGFLGLRYAMSGPIYVGTGWHPLGTNVGASQVNNRAGDTLLADHFETGTRYCAKENSWDSTFSNNPIGNGNASSFALLGSTPDRC